jgi:hypothetical protein
MTVLLGVAVSATLIGAGLTGCNLDTEERYTQADSTDSGPRGASSLTGPGDIRIPDRP